MYTICLVEDEIDLSNVDQNGDKKPDKNLTNQDTNGDGKCDLNCDVNNDGKISVADARKIVVAIAKNDFNF